MRAITGLEELRAAEGETLGTTGWHTISQEQVDAFAQLTGDHQWIHVDRERAAASPLGTTIVHGYFTLSLVSLLLDETVAFRGFAYGLNYGVDRVRFPAPMPVGARLRMTTVLAAVAPIAGGAQITLALTLEREGHEKPVCVAETLARFTA